MGRPPLSAAPALQIQTSVDSPRRNRLFETKLDAEFNFLERVRQDQAKKEHEKAKALALARHREAMDKQINPEG